MMTSMYNIGLQSVQPRSKSYCITLRGLQKVFSYVDHCSIEQCFMLKRNSAFRMMKINGEIVSNVANPRKALAKCQKGFLKDQMTKFRLF